MGGGYLRYSKYSTKARTTCNNLTSRYIGVGNAVVNFSSYLAAFNLTCRNTSDRAGGEVEAGQYGVVGTLAWIGNSGAYLDFQAGYFQADLTASASASSGTGSVETNLRAASALAELGRKFDIGNKFFVTPHARIQYNSFDHDLIELSNHRQVRAGVLVSYESAEDRRIYGEINIARDNVSSFEETTGEIGFGGNLPVGEDEKANLSLGVSIVDVLDSFGDNLSLIGNVKLAIPF